MKVTSASFWLVCKISLKCTWVKGGASSKSLVPLLEGPEHGEEQHLVSCLPGRIQKLPGRHIVVGSWLTHAHQTRNTRPVSVLQRRTHRRCGWTGGLQEPAAWTAEPPRSHRWPWKDAANTVTKACLTEVSSADTPSVRACECMCACVYVCVYLLPSACPETAGGPVDRFPPETAAGRPESSKQKERQQEAVQELLIQSASGSVALTEELSWGGGSDCSAA